MSKAIIYHNPRCSKSRETLALLEEKGECATVVEYLDTPPSKEELGQILDMLGIEPEAIVRKKEALFKELGLNAKALSRDEWLETLTTHPKLIERPIVVKNGKAAIGRPPSLVLDIL